LVQLIAIDLEKRWQLPAAEEPTDGPICRLRLPDYMGRFPDLLGSDGPPEELICQEYYVRCRWGGRPSHQEYLQAHGQQHANLEELLAAEDAELGIAETMPCADNSCSGPEEERRLAERVRAGEDLALQILLMRTYDGLLHYIQRRIPSDLTNVVSADDVLQATHIQAFRFSCQFGGESGHTFLNWLTAIADSLLRSAVSAAVEKKYRQHDS